MQIHHDYEEPTEPLHAEPDLEILETAIEVDISEPVVSSQDLEIVHVAETEPIRPRESTRRPLTPKETPEKRRKNEKSAELEPVPIKKPPVVTKAALKMPPPPVQTPKPKGRRPGRKPKNPPRTSISPEPEREDLTALKTRMEQENRKRPANVMPGSNESAAKRARPEESYLDNADRFKQRLHEINMDRRVREQLEQEKLRKLAEQREQRLADEEAKRVAEREAAKAEAARLAAEEAARLEKVVKEEPHAATPTPQVAPGELRSSSFHTPNDSGDSDIEIINVVVGPPKPSQPNITSSNLESAFGKGGRPNLMTKDDIAKADKFIEEQSIARANRVMKSTTPIVYDSEKLAEMRKNLSGTNIYSSNISVSLSEPGSALPVKSEPTNSSDVRSDSESQQSVTRKSIAPLDERSQFLTGLARSQKENGNTSGSKYSRGAVRHVEEDEAETRARRGNRRIHPDFEKSKRDAEEASIHGEQAARSTSNLKEMTREYGLPKVSKRFRKFISIRNHPNGGGTMVSCDYLRVSKELNQTNHCIREFARQFVRLGFAEFKGVPVFCIGIIENGAQEFNDILTEIVKDYDNLMVKVGSLTSKQLIETMPIRRYFESALETLSCGTFR